MLCRLIRVTIILIVVSIVNGRAYSYLDEKGNEHTVGLFFYKSYFTGKLIYSDKTTLGLSMELSESDGYFGIGYRNSIRVFVPDNSLLSVDKEYNNVHIDLEKTD